MKTLYVAEADPKGKEQLLAFPVKEDGSVGGKRHGKTGCGHEDGEVANHGILKKTSNGGKR